MNRCWVLASWMMAVVAAGGCGDDASSSTGGGGTGGDGGTGAIGGVPVGGSGGTGGGGGDPQIAGCAQATAMQQFEVHAHYGQGVIEAPNERDYFLLPVEAGTWLALFTARAPDAPPVPDVAARVWTADGTTLLASGDDPYPWLAESNGMEIHFRVPADGTYCVEVMHPGDWAGGTGEGGPLFEYTLITNPLPLFYGGNADMEMEPNDTVAEASPDVYPPEFVTSVYGTFESANDVDYYAFDAANEISFVVFRPTRAPELSKDGWGPLGTPPRVTLVDAAGVPLIARNAADAMETCEDFNFCWAFAETIPGNTYYFRVERASQEPFTAGEMYSIVLGGSATLVLPPEDPLDATMGTNDTSATAQDAPSGPLTSFGPSFWFSGSLHDGDVDWWRIPAGAQGQELTVYCRSLTIGSGVTSFTVQAYSEANLGAATPDQEQTETATQPVSWGNVPHQAMPTISGEPAQYLRLSSSSFDPELTSRYYRCESVRMDGEP